MTYHLGMFNSVAKPPLIVCAPLSRMTIGPMERVSRDSPQPELEPRPTTSLVSRISKHLQLRQRCLHFCAAGHGRFYSNGLIFQWSPYFSVIWWINGMCEILSILSFGRCIQRTDMNLLVCQQAINLCWKSFFLIILSTQTCSKLHRNPPRAGIEPRKPK